MSILLLPNALFLLETSRMLAIRKALAGRGHRPGAGDPRRHVRMGSS
jgi:hypothetical protein